MKKTSRIVIDTNIWISYLIGQTLTYLTENIHNRQIIIWFSDEIIG
ncbi:putative toxin-antitoxin system toxin component, PIN family [candidate division KSB1 bacterium]|nr:putative toxin-antitoxin system toxin component, PIN family [candidate division KSB1 bacterium]